MAVEGLGRLFNYGTSTGLVATAARMSLKNYAGCGIVVVGATGNTPVTVNEANAATGGTSQGLVKVTRYYQQAAGAGTWTKVLQAAAAASGNIGAGGIFSCYIDGTQLSDGFTYLQAGHATGTVLYVLHDVEVQRDPRNLASVLL